MKIFQNECWNGQFECYHYMVNQSQEENMSVWQWYGQRVCQIRKIFDGVYGDKSAKSLYTVLGTQEVNSWITNQVSKTTINLNSVNLSF